MTLQFIVDGLLSGATIGLGAVGITLSYSLLRFANFAHGEFITWGCYATWLGASALGAAIPAAALPLGSLSATAAIVAAGLLAMALTGLLALLVDAVLFRPLRRRGTAASALIASFGASMALRALLEAGIPAQQAYLSSELQIAVPVLGLFRVTPDQLALGAGAAVLAGALHGLLARTAFGRSMRAVSENPALARLSGVDVERVIAHTWLLGGALACAAGIMLGLLVQMRASMGAELLLPLFAAAIVGGIGSVPGALLGGLVVGLAEAAAVSLVGAPWRAAVAFGVVMLTLLLRPQGLFGRAAP